MKKYWLSWGIMGGFLSVITSGIQGLNFLILPFILPLLFLDKILSPDPIDEIIFSYLYFFVAGFLAGALFGYLYGTYKKSNPVGSATLNVVEKQKRFSVFGSYLIALLISGSVGYGLYLYYMSTSFLVYNGFLSLLFIPVGTIYIARFLRTL